MRWIALLPLLLLAACAASRSAAVASSRSTGLDKALERGDMVQPVRVSMATSMGDIVLELDPAHAPVTVANFLKYVDAGAYDGTTFHRVVPGFVIQGGGWTSDLKERAKQAAAAGPRDTPIRNEWQNGLKNVRGTIAMARDEQPDTATREFYMNLKDNPKLDTPRATTGNAGYAVFGRVVAGMDVVERIGSVETRSVEVAGVTDGSMQNVPVKTVVIHRVIRGGQPATR
jgi:peptidyl-prolyl cis-trans isomerase A (cyclophilin A)